MERKVAYNWVSIKGKKRVLLGGRGGGVEYGGDRELKEAKAERI